jgi:hypothetical protein
MDMTLARTAALILLALMTLASAPRNNDRYFVVEVTDAATGRGVPLIELRTTHLARYVTDSGGVIAMDEPGLEGRAPATRSRRTASATGACG